MKLLAKERTKLKMSAQRKPETAKPGTMASASIMSKAFITKIKRPRVSTVIGRVRIMSKGFTSALISPSTSANTRATKKLDTVTPGNIYATASITSADTSQLINILNIKVLYHKMHSSQTVSLFAFFRELEN